MSELYEIYKELIDSHSRLEAEMLSLDINSPWIDQVCDAIDSLDEALAIERNHEECDEVTYDRLTMQQMGIKAGFLGDMP